MTTLDPGASEVLTHGLEARPRSTALRASSPAASITDGLEVLVQLVMAAITTWPWSRSNRVPSSSWTATRLLGRPLAPVGLDLLGVAGLGVGVVPQALLLGIGLDQRDQLGRAAGELEVAQGLGVDREDGAGRPVLGRHVADGGPVLDRHVADPGAVELDELAHHPVAAQQLGHGQ